MGAARRRRRRREPRGEWLPPAARGRVRPPGVGAARRRPTTSPRSSSATSASSTTRPVDPPTRRGRASSLVARGPGRPTRGRRRRRAALQRLRRALRTHPRRGRVRNDPQLDGVVGRPLPPAQPAAHDAGPARARHPRLPDRRVLRHAAERAGVHRPVGPAWARPPSSPHRSSPRPTLLHRRLGAPPAGTPYDVYLCHVFCELGAVKMVDEMRVVRRVPRRAPARGRGDGDRGLRARPTGCSPCSGGRARLDAAPGRSRRAAPDPASR